MANAPDACPSCGTAVPPGRTRCPGCGKVFGEDNRCPSCHAVSAVYAAGAGYVCAACSAPRERLPDTVVLEGGGGVRLPSSRRPPAQAAVGAGAAALAPRTAQVATRGASTGLRLAGFGAIGLGVFAAVALGLLVPGATGLVLAAVLGGGFVAAGAGGLWAGARAGERADERASANRELAILTLAEKSGGDLTATEVARGLGLSLQDADDSLTAMADGSRITVEVDPEGVVHYVFRELAPDEAGAPRLRIDASLAPRAAVEEAEEALADEEAAAARERGEG